MINYVNNPNLPEYDVDTVICGTEDESVLEFFEKMNINVLKNESNSLIDPSVSSHADMAVLHLGGKSLLIDKAQKGLAEKLRHEGFIVFSTDSEIKGDYPDDVKLNFTVAGDKITGNFRYADSKLTALADKKKAINVKQGYAKCATLVVNENAVITDDESISRVMGKNAVDCLLVSKGDILLEGHEYGFIGGASGKISKNTVVFFGDIKNHRDYNDIEAFLSKHQCGFVCSDKLPLRDIGGIIPLIEKPHG